MPVLAPVAPIAPIGPTAPRVVKQPGALEGLGQAVGAFGEVFHEMKKQDDALYLNKANQDYLTKSDALKDEVAQQEPDALKRIDLYKKKQGELLADLTKKAPSRDAQNAVAEHVGLAATRDFINYKAQAGKDYRDGQLAQLDEQEQTLINQLATEPDAQKREQLRTTHEAVLTGLTAGRLPVLTQQERVKRMQSIDSEVQRTQALKTISNDADSFIQNVDGSEYAKIKPEERQKLLDSAFKARDSQYLQADKRVTALHNVVMDQRRSWLQAGQVTNADLDEWAKMHGAFGLSGPEYEVMKNDLASGPAAGRDPSKIQQIRNQFGIAGDSGINQAIDAARRYERQNPMDPAGSRLREDLEAQRRRLQAEGRSDKAEARNSVRTSVKAHIFNGRTLYDQYMTTTPVERALGINKAEKLADVLNQADALIESGKSAGEVKAWAIEQLTKGLAGGTGQPVLRPETEKYLNGR